MPFLLQHLYKDWDQYYSTTNLLTYSTKYEEKNSFQQIKFECWIPDILFSRLENIGT